MRIGVITTSGHDQVIRRTINTREWEAYRENGEDISRALKTLGHEAHIIPDGLSLVESIAKHRIELAWVCTGGIQGRNSISHTPGILEMLGIPYLGAFPLALAVADHKPTAKQIVAFHGYRTPTFQTMTLESADINPGLRFPLMVKPVTGMCSCGVYKTDSVEELQRRVHDVLLRYPDEVLVEEFIDGRNLSVPVLGELQPFALPAVERFFYALDDAGSAKTGAVLAHPNSSMRESHSFDITCSNALLKRAGDLAVELFTCLNLRHFARFDFQVDSNDNIYFLEANAKPDLARQSLFAQAAKRIGLNYVELIHRLLLLHPSG